MVLRYAVTLQVCTHPKGTHSTICSRRQWIPSARVAGQMNQWNCGRHTDNWTIADSFISVFPCGHSPASQRRNSGSFADIHMRLAVYRMILGQDFFTHFRSTLSQCSSERYSQIIIRLSHRNPTTTKQQHVSVFENGLYSIPLSLPASYRNTRRMQYTVQNCNCDLYTKNNLVVQPNRKKQWYLKIHYRGQYMDLKQTRRWKKITQWRV